MARYIDADLEVSKFVTVWDCDCSEFGKQTVMAVDDLHYLPTADVAPRADWISVEERLPERELQELKRMNPLKVFPCLVVITSDYYNKAYVSQAYYAEEGFISGYSGLITERITHWMPIPEPPKGDRHEM